MEFIKSNQRCLIAIYLRFSSVRIGGSRRVFRLWIIIDRRGKKRADGNSSFQGFALSRRSRVNRAFQSHFQEKLRADRAVQPAGAEDGSPGEGLLVPQDDGVGQGRGWVTSPPVGCFNPRNHTGNSTFYTFPVAPDPAHPSLSQPLALFQPHLDTNGPVFFAEEAE